MKNINKLKSYYDVTAVNIRQTILERIQQRVKTERKNNLTEHPPVIYSF